MMMEGEGVVDGNFSGFGLGEMIMVMQLLKKQLFNVFSVVVTCELIGVSILVCTDLFF